MSKNNWRVNLVLAVIFIAGGIVLSRLFYLQINKGNYYKAMAQGQQMSIEDTTGERGTIYFAGGEPLALTEHSAYVFISPDEISANDKENVADLLSKSLGIPKSEILAKANISGSQYQIIQNDLTEEKATEIKNLKLKGVYLDSKQIRSYPNKTIAAQLSGYLNKDGVGQYGVEGYYDNVLKGKSTIKKTASNPFNFFSGGDDDNINGSSLYLTVDYNIQYMAEKLLAKGVKEYDAKGGEIIVMDPATGAIIAMAQYPLFDPNNYQKEKDYDIFQNDSIQKIFEPGSIFKSVTMAAAINENAITPETTCDDKLGYKMYGSYKVSNYSDHVWGVITMTNALEHSINTGLMFAEEKLGHQKFYNYLENFGFFENTEIDLPGEVHSANNQLATALEKNNPNNTSFPNASFGQGIGITPLHVTASYCAIANGGNLVRPHIVKEIDNGIQKKEIQPETSGRIISTETSTKMKTMMISVIENGYGHLAKIPGYYVAGKTGTSQVPWTSLGENKAGYSPETWQTFLGFAPAYNPRFVALVKLDNPTAVKTSEYSATPIFHDLAKYILNYWQIPYDYDPNQPATTTSKK